MSINKIVKDEIWERIKRQDDVRETTITQNIMDKILLLNVDNHFLLKARNESKSGADIEWWIVDKKDGAITLRIQAKRLRDYNKSQKWYGDLEHCLKNRTNNGDDQLEALIESSDTPGTIRSDSNKKVPLYCFYNYFDSGDFKEGWTYTYAHKIRELRQKDLSSTKKDYRLFDTIHPHCEQMIGLYNLIKRNPTEILLNYNKQMGNNLNLEEYYCPRIPKYVKNIMSPSVKETLVDRLKETISNFIMEIVSPPPYRYLFVTKTDEIFDKNWFKQKY